MEIVEFEQLIEMDMLEIEGGCRICTAGAVIGGAGTGAGTVLAVGALCGSNPAGWVIGLGALAGAGLGYLVSQ